MVVILLIDLSGGEMRLQHPPRISREGFIAVLQATPQIHEMTLSFVPKIVSVILALLAASPWMLSKISHFTSQLILSIPQIIK